MDKILIFKSNSILKILIIKLH